MIEFTDISIKLGDFSLENISFKVNKGEYLVILGPSGAGKTVILEILAGLFRPSSGTLKGVRNGQTALLYQDYMLFPHLNVFRNIAFGLEIRNKTKTDIKNKVEKISDILNIRHLLDRSIHGLSGGECQRIAIARAYAIEPELFLLDEPTSALDRNTRRGILELFRDIHKKSGSTFIHVTHDFEEALYLADRILIIHDGKMIQSGTPEEIFDHPESRIVADFVGIENIFQGSIKNNSFVSFNDDSFAINLQRPDSLKVYAAIKANDIIISSESFKSSARNQLSGTVEEIIHRLSTTEVKFKVGKSFLNSVVTKMSFEEMKIESGKQYWLTFKSSAVKIFPH